MPDTFYASTGWEQSSGPITNIQVHEADIWPVDDNSISGTKDTVDPGKHPVVAVGGRTGADGRPLNLTGVVMTVLEGITEPVDLVQLNVADGFIVRQYVCNIYTHPSTYEQAPIVGQPVYVDDSAALSAGVTLSLAAWNSANVPNPLAGYLWYCQDEYADAVVGGPNHVPLFDGALPNEKTEQEYCVLLVNHGRDLDARPQ